MAVLANSKLEELHDAFSMFNEVSKQLASSYEDLESRVETLNDELAQAHDARLEELTEKERVADRLASLLKALPAGVVVLDSEGYIQEANPQAISLLGEPLIGLLWREVIARAFAPRSDDGHEVSLKDGRLVSISTQSLGSEPGQIILLQDVTEARALQARLSQHKRLTEMGEMTASLAHQIRTPLSSALLYASQQTSKTISDENRVRFSSKIVASLRHLESLVNDMLLFAKGDSLIKQQVTVSDLILMLDNTVERVVHDCHFGINVDSGIETLSMQLNQQAMIGALANLIENATQHGDDSMDIRVNISRTEDVNGHDALLIAVQDNGPGIPQDVLQRIFDPFFTTRMKGTGLGLAVVQAVARAHNGAVWVESEIGSGTTFTLCIPVLEQVENATHNELLAGEVNE